MTYWGPPPGTGSAPVVLLHGWLDAGGSFQFLVDALHADRTCLAPDLRGFGRSEWPQSGYHFSDYLGDLDALLEAVSPAAPVHLVGHSMGGNVASLYAGLRPARVRSLVNLEGLGLPRTQSADAPARLRQWLEQLRTPLPDKHYASFEQLAQVVRARYPRIGAEVAAFIAQLWGALRADGRVALSADPRHHWVSPVLYKREDAEAVWREITAPMVLLLGEKSEYLRSLGPDGSSEALARVFGRAVIRSVPDAGHMLHFEQPQAVASIIEEFLAANE